MHRHSDETVAAVVHAAITELRRRESRCLPMSPELTAMAERVRLTRVGRMPREQYEDASRPGDPLYDNLPVTRRDEDRVLWLVTQALTGD